MTPEQTDYVRGEVEKGLEAEARMRFEYVKALMRAASSGVRIA